MASRLVKMAVARDLAERGLVQGIELVGVPGGWTVKLHIGTEVQLLSTKQNQVRLYKDLDRAFQFCRDLGIAKMRLDGEQWAKDGFL